MPTCRTDRSTSRAAEAQAKVLAAQQDLSQEEPMRRYPHPISVCTAASGSAASADLDLDRILEQLSCQSQLLVDLLGAVNALTAATLSQNNKS